MVSHIMWGQAVWFAVFFVFLVAWERHVNKALLSSDWRSDVYEHGARSERIGVANPPETEETRESFHHGPDVVLLMSFPNSVSRSKQATAKRH